MRCLGVGSRGRYKLTPDIPTLIEQGIPDFELMTWTGVLMPAGVPQPVFNDAARGDREDHHRARLCRAPGRRAARRSRPARPRRCGSIQVAEIELYRDMMKIAGIEPE